MNSTPLTWMVWPLTYRPVGSHRGRTIAASSSGLPTRPTTGSSSPAGGTAPAASLGNAAPGGLVRDVGEETHAGAAEAFDLRRNAARFRLGGPGVDDDRGAVRRQAERDGAADPPHRTGDQRDLARQGFRRAGAHDMPRLAARSTSRAQLPIDIRWQ